MAMLVGMVACGPSQPAPAQPRELPPTSVQVAAAQMMPIDDAVEYVATLKSLKSTAIQPQIEGQITQIVVKSGDRVSAGAPLMQIDPRRQEAAVSSQEAERTAREANVGFARQQRERANQLFTAGAISRQELEQAETALRTAEANLQALQAQVQQQQVQLRYYTIAAPTAGVIGDVPARVGMQVTTQTTVTTIDENDVLEVQVAVPIERAGSLKVGLPLLVFGSDGAERLATSTVNFVSPRVDDQTQSILVKGAVRNPDGRLRSSQFVRARIVFKTSDALTVPVTAVLRVNGSFFAFIAEDEKGQLLARQRAIRVGPIAGNAYPILDGIRAGERVVVSGVQKLIDRASIAPVPPASPDAPALGPKP